MAKKSVKKKSIKKKEAAVKKNIVKEKKSIKQKAMKMKKIASGASATFSKSSNPSISKTITSFFKAIKNFFTVSKK